MCFMQKIQPSHVRGRLCREEALDLHRASELVNNWQKQSSTYQNSMIPKSCSVIHRSKITVWSSNTKEIDNLVPAFGNVVGYFFGSHHHPRQKCSARDAVRKGCGKRWHFFKGYVERHWLVNDFLQLLILPLLYWLLLLHTTCPTRLLR